MYSLCNRLWPRFGRAPFLGPARRRRASAGHLNRVLILLSSPARFSGVQTKRVRVCIGGLGCGKALTEVPGIEPGVGGATSFSSGEVDA